MTSHRIALAQFDFPVGAVDDNAARIIDLMHQARDRHGAGLVLFPELALCGYMPEDQLYRDSLIEACEAALARVAAAAVGIEAVVGHPLRVGKRLYNAASWLRDGRVLTTCRKQALPNYAVFDEKRYFEAGDAPCLVDWQGLRVGLLICEDLWHEVPIARVVEGGAELVFSVNASPFEDQKADARQSLLTSRVAAHGLPLAYVNCVGGQDDLVFDGGSLIADGDGTVHGPPAAFSDALLVCDYDAGGRRWRAPDWAPAAREAHEAVVWRGLVRGIADYVGKHGFPGVLLGLSGGIDSALTLALAVDALGADRVHAVLLPSRHTSQDSIDLALAQARALGVRHDRIDIEPAYQAFLASLAPLFEGHDPDLTEENLQARCRGTLLMALSNKFGHLLLATGNKSEMAVGYSTLYGDMCGGYAPIKDCYKTQVYALARWRNGRGDGEGIPQAVIDRPPTAELRDNQRDDDSLPPYEVLDAILHGFIDRQRSREQIEADGHDGALVTRVIAMVYRAEYKRRQSAPGPKITGKAFGRDRRYPITSAWR
ncbi:MAG: NAD+ synthase [Xanthomonadales bacterium]|nr:NAD+ synthase [Xanthomonadales bacterium]